jgi:hypothetical protein
MINYHAPTQHLLNSRCAKATAHAVEEGYSYCYLFFKAFLKVLLFR